MDTKAADLTKDSYSTAAGFCMWEIGRIGINVVQPSGEMVFIDLTRSDAAKLAVELMGACNQFDELEALCQQADEYCEHIRDNVPGSCARCEGT